MRFVPTAVVSILILIAVLLPGSNVPDVNIAGFDKVVHIGMFGLWAWAIRYDFFLSRFNFLLAMSAGLAFSLFTELLQIFVEGRSFDWTDMVADGVGLVLGLVTGGWVARYLRKAS
jgi:VanZ family protein